MIEKEIEETGTGKERKKMKEVDEETVTMIRREKKRESDQEKGPRNGEVGVS